MSTIDLSPQTLINLNTSIFSENYASNSAAGANNAPLLAAYGGGATDIGVMAVMKGIVPSNFSTLTSYSARSSDVLILYTNFGGGSNMFSTSNIGQNPAIISTVYQAAQQTGTATWLWWMSVLSTGGGYPNINTTSAPFVQIIGSIGITGSGADFIMSSTSIVTGVQYRVINIEMSIPNPWTF